MPFWEVGGYFELETGGIRGNSGRSCERLAERAGSGEIAFWAVNAQPHQGERLVDLAVFPPTGNSLLDILSDMGASRLNVKEQSAMDAQDEGMGDAGDLREFALRMLLREFVERAGRAETAEDPGQHQEGVGPAVHPALAAPGARAGDVVEMADMAAVSAGADCGRGGLTLR